MVVVGSGATAVTLVPAMAEHAAHATMLQRTPTWMVAQPSRDKWARCIRKWLGEERGSRLVRWINVRMHRAFFLRARSEPEEVGRFLLSKMREALGPCYKPEDFEPPYGPWQQRLCLVPDGNFFHAVRNGAASVVTGRISGFDRGAVLLESGERLPADILVTATGLKLLLGGKIDVSVDGDPVDWPKHWFYRGCMFSNLPNLTVVFGYLNNSWTLRADNTAAYTCRVLQRMEETGAGTVTPVMPDDHGLEEANIILFSSGYLQRARPLMPKSAGALPWRLNMDYLEDCRDLRQRPISDGLLHFESRAQSPVAPAREIA